MPPALIDQIFRMPRARSVDIPLALDRLASPVIWMHCDQPRAAQVLSALSSTLLQRAPGFSVLLSYPEGVEEPPDLPGRVCMALPVDEPEIVTRLLARHSVAAALIIAQNIPSGVITALGRGGVPVILAEADAPCFASRWGRMPGFARAVLAHISTVCLPNEAARSAWRDAGMADTALVSCGRLSATPVALGCNESEREELAENFRHRTIWLASGVPEREEEAVRAAHREALRESHRLALILHPADPMRGPMLRDKFSEQFITALRSEDDQISPETQVYIADTEGERGLWYRLAVACFLGGTLGGEGASYSPMEAAGLGCAIVHGRMFGRFSEPFDLLREARATRMIQSADALGSAICTALRPEQAADQAHRAWQVISNGSEATDTVINAVLAAAAREEAS
jgi:3-deoxy-D-manno-octulosonic-acid transferase